MAITLIMFGWLMMFAALVVWALQGAAWLYYGEWITFTLLELWRKLDFEAPRFEWKAVEKTVLWIMALSPGQALMLFGLTLTVGVNLLADRSEKSKARAEQREAEEKRRIAKAKFARPPGPSPLDVEPS
jgi:hypothetical protein